MKKLIKLNDKPERYALHFRYHTVTQMTLAMALPYDLKKRCVPIKFTPEDKHTAGRARLNNAIFREKFPEEFAVFMRKLAGDAKEYILIEIGTNK